MGYEVRGDDVFYSKRVYVFAIWRAPVVQDKDHCYQSGSPISAK